MTIYGVGLVFQPWHIYAHPFYADRFSPPLFGMRGRALIGGKSLANRLSEPLCAFQAARISGRRPISRLIESAIELIYSQRRLQNVTRARYDISFSLLLLFAASSSALAGGGRIYVPVELIVFVIFIVGRLLMGLFR